MLPTLFSHVIIPALMLLLARGTDWFSTNFSSIRTALSRQGEFLVWSLVTGGYFYYMIRKLLRKRRRNRDTKKETALFILSARMMVLFVLTPYLPARFPLLSAVHVASALSCCILFFLCLFLLILDAYWESPRRYRPCLLWLYWSVVFCICAFLLTGIINSAMEICFVFTCSLLCRRLLLLEEQQFR